MKKNNQLIPACLPETKEAYEAPVIETVEVRVEQGFFQSSSPASLNGEPGDNEYLY